MSEKLETPCWATNTMCAQMAEMEAPKQYAQISNAHLELVSGVPQPCWVMELYDKDKVTAVAILEAPAKGRARYFYIAYGGVHRQTLIDRGQTYAASENGYDAHIFSNEKGEVCVEWL